MNRPAIRKNFAAVIGCLSIFAASWLCRAGTLAAQQLPKGNPYSPLSTTAKYERQRDYDLKNIFYRLTLDWPKRQLQGDVTETLSPLKPGLRELKVDAGPNLSVSKCLLNGTAVKFKHDGTVLSIQPPAPPAPGKNLSIEIIYQSEAALPEQRRTASNPGIRWVNPDRFEPARRPAFWTSGWPENNHFWLPAYDYPNDRATVEAFITVPPSWYAMANGALQGVVKSTRAYTYHWKSEKPISTYLIAVSAGEMDVAQEKRAGVPLIYGVPKGEGPYIRPSFGHTAEMISFFSSKLGVPFPWDKYGQTAVFDFNFGGMENASCTTLAEFPLAEARSGSAAVDSLVSHELAHQWFGDLITYRDWSQAWLSEGFATYFQQVYTEHSQGKDAFGRDRESALQAYLSESRRYHRPIVTHYYPRPDDMLDSHTYPKAGLILHMLRRELGDKQFFAGLGHYLKKHAYSVVETSDLTRAIKEATGRDVSRFIDQWIMKPGHPLLGYTWKEENGKAIVDVSQIQDTKDGTPVYDLPLTIAVIGKNGNVQRSRFRLTSARQQFAIQERSPAVALLIDPDHDLLLERKPYDYTGKAIEQEAVARYAPNSIDREAALIALIDSSASTFKGPPGTMTMERLQRETSPACIANVLSAMAPKQLVGVRAGYREFLHHKDARVREAAIKAIGALPATEEDTVAVRTKVEETEQLRVINAALAALGGWDPDENLDVIRRGFKMDSRHDVIRIAAINALARAYGDTAAALALQAMEPQNSRPVRFAAVDLMRKAFPGRAKVTQGLVNLVRDEDPQVRNRAVNVLIARVDKSAIPDIRAIESSATDPAVRAAAKRATEGLQGR